MNQTDIIKALESYGVYVQHMQIKNSYGGYPTIEFDGYIKKEQINELENLKMEKITNQTTAFEAIKARRIVIGSIDSNGNFSVAVNPAVQLSVAGARAECKRLAQITPGKLFTFMQFGGAEMVPNATLSI